MNLNPIIIVGIGWIIFAFVIGFMIGAFVGYKLAVRNLPEVSIIKQYLKNQK